jgi:hypothetical protein
MTPSSKLGPRPNPAPASLFGGTHAAPFRLQDRADPASTSVFGGMGGSKTAGGAGEHVSEAGDAEGNTSEAESDTPITLLGDTRSHTKQLFWNSFKRRPFW